MHLVRYEYHVIEFICMSHTSVPQGNQLMVADRRLKSFLGVHVELELTIEASLLRDGVFWDLCDRGSHVAEKSDYYVSLWCFQIFCPRPRYIKF